MDNGFYFNELEKLQKKYEDKIERLSDLSLEDVDGYEIGMIQGETESYKDVLIDILSLLVKGVKING